MQTEERVCPVSVRFPSSTVIGHWRIAIDQWHEKGRTSSWLFRPARLIHVENKRRYKGEKLFYSDDRKNSWER